ncbi:hypothetical protein [Nostoc sp.]|uniref:hypothetical protein n=1 Tax=Nostoc sp. TaxID=1180 RepID=UPI002FF627D8
MKASLELAFRLPRSQSPAGNARRSGSASLYWRQSRQEQHFQPPAGNEVLKEF